MVQAQTPERIKIDSLERQLAQLKDSSRIDCFNLIAQTIVNAISGNFTDIGLWTQKADSIYHYASIAYNEAMKIGYKKGIARSLANMGSSEFTRGVGLRINKKDDSVSVYAGEKYLLTAITLAGEINNDEILGRAYYDLAPILFFKSKRQDLTISSEYYKKAIHHLHKAGIEGLEGEACTWLCEDYSQRGYYDEGIEYCQRSMELAKKAVTKAKTPREKEYKNYLMQQSLADIADLYKTAGDYETAMSYLRQARQFGIENKTGWEMEDYMAGVYMGLSQYDSAMYYMMQLKGKSPKNFYLEAGIGQIYLKTKDYDRALVSLLESVDSLWQKTTNGRPVMPFLLNIGDVYCEKQNYKAAIKYAREGTNIAIKLGARPSVMDGYELLSRIHYNNGNTDSAYQYLLKYVTLKDSLENRQFIFRLNNFKKAAEDAKKESRIGFLNRDNQIKQQQLKQEATFRNFLIAVFIAIVFAGLYAFRNITLKRNNERLKQEQKEQEWKLKELENENKHVELQKQSAELEMQALRAQMNPHFIFNCLSSINRFILKNESKTASNYLTRFSRLMRMVLMNSQKPLIALESELEMLGLYLEMERLRFKNSFDYAITFLNAIDSDNVFIPPLLLQPFCENAIWHGLMHKEGQGRLDVELSMQDNILYCAITDNGVGREKAEEMNSKTAEKEKSMGLRITTERLALLNREKGLHTFYEIEDIIDENGNATGTKVILKISFKESVEATV